MSKAQQIIDEMLEAQTPSGNNTPSVDAAARRFAQREYDRVYNALTGPADPDNVDIYREAMQDGWEPTPEQMAVLL